MTATRRFAFLLVAALVPAVVLGVFIGALAAADHGTATVPAAIVNQDKFVQTTGADGKKTTIAAGRLIVSDLTKKPTSTSGATIDWQLSNATDAAAALKRGDVYAIVTIPAGFSKAISTVSGSSPVQARIDVTTDDAHGAVVSQLDSALAGTITGTLGTTIAKSVVTGLYTGYGSLRTSLSKAADGATKIGTGADSLSTGLTKIANGQDKLASGLATIANGQDSLASGLNTAASAAQRSATGAGRIATGVSKYTKGVDALAGGLRTAATQTKAVPAGVAALVQGDSTASAGIAQVLAADPTIDARSRAALQQIATGLGTAGTQGAALSTGVAGMYTAISRSASGTEALSAGSSSLRSGTASLASGLGQLAAGIGTSAAGAAQLGSGAHQSASGAAQLGSGTHKSASGAKSLATGAASLGSGLATGADKLPAVKSASKTAAAVVQPVTAHTVREHKVSSLGTIVSALIIPVALWIGAAAAVLLFGPVRRRLLATGVGTGRLTGSAFGRGSLLAAAQAVLLLVVLVSTLGLSWSAVPMALLVGIVAGISFFAVHQLLGALFGRAGSIISVVLLGVQLVAVGGLYPIELVSEPFRVISPFLPLTSAVNAMQTVITGAPVGPAFAALAALALWALVAYAATTAVTASRRTRVALFQPPGVPSIG